jgi:hypothetical protein
MSSSSESHASSSNIDDFTFISSDEEILEVMGQEDMVIFHCMAIVFNSHDFLNSHEIEKGVGQAMDPIVGV